MTTKRLPKSHPAKSRVLLVDDHAILRQGLTGLINQQPDLAVCCQAATAPQALTALKKGHPEIAVVDLGLPGRGGLELIKDMHARFPELPVLVLSMFDESLYAERVLHAGARGYIMKEADAEKLLSAIRRVLAGEIYLSEKMQAKTLPKRTRSGTPVLGSPVELLSDRELDVFRTVGEGRSASEIARAFHLSVKTIEFHRANIKRKLKVRTSTELLRHAVQWLESNPTP